MKKLFLSLFIIINLFAINDKSKIENLMQNNYQKYYKLIDKLFPKESYSIDEIVKILINNGLIDLFFKDVKTIQTKFIFLNSNPVLEYKILNNSLRSLGYYYFYPVQFSNIDNLYSITLEMKTEHFIDPETFIEEITSRGCKIIDISRDNNKFIYKVDCANGFIKEAKLLTSKTQRFVNADGVYWIKNDDFVNIIIKTSRLDSWHPSVWFYDDRMNLIDVFRKNEIERNLELSIPQGSYYIKIIDMYSGENFKRGIIVKGLK